MAFLWYSTQTVGGRTAIASRLFDLLRQAGIPEDFILFDPLVLAVSVESDAGLVTPEAVRAVHHAVPQSLPGKKDSDLMKSC